MRRDRSTALKLRLQGKTYSEIQKLLGGISKSTLSTWLKKVILPEKARSVIARKTREKSFQGLLKRNENQTALSLIRKDEIRKAARSEIKSISPRDLLMLGLSLYWAEGYKRPIVRNGREVTYHPVSITNSDPKLVKAFLVFLRGVCGAPVSKIRADVRIFQHLNEDMVLRYWSKELGIPRENFRRTYVGTSRSSMGKRPFNRLPYGVIQIRISDTNLFHKIMGWIEGLKAHF